MTNYKRILISKVSILFLCSHNLHKKEIFRKNYKQSDVVDFVFADLNFGVKRSKFKGNSDYSMNNRN